MEHEDEFLDIFSWLPVKSICKFSSLSKSFSRIPSENFFIKKQCHNMQLAGDKDFFIQPYLLGMYMGDKLELHSCTGGTTDIALSVPYSSLEFIEKNGRILCSGNGLVCCKNFSNINYKPLFICNPATQYWLELSNPDGTSNYNIRYPIFLQFYNADNEITDDFKLMTVMWPVDWSSDPHFKIYSSSEKIWKDGGIIKIGSGRNIRYETALSHNGVIYLLSDSGRYYVEGQFFWPYVVAYDVENCGTKFLKLPEDSRRGLHGDDWRLGIFLLGNTKICNQSVCFVNFNENVFSIWVLTDEEKSSWQKVFEKHVNNMGLRWYSDEQVAGFTILRGEILLIATDSWVYQYDLSSEGSGEIEEVCRHECRTGFGLLFHSFSSTLRSCGAGAEKLPADSDF